MALENKLGITDSAEFARAEEKISKTRVIELCVKLAKKCIYVV